ncbi:MAG: hypothetical protein OEM76_05240 [Gammaproteobacteria bacterium]|nr:hypothetical protein [Gammaproteobacteria bacterium]
MKINTFLIIGLAVALTGCSEQEQAAPPTEGADAEMVSKAVTGDVSAPELTGMGSETFIRHMHLHATHLSGLNDALASGDLEAAKTPAHWLLRHEEVTGHPDAWQPHIDNMRNAARAVAEAADITAARSAAQRVTESCSACHVAAGVTVDLSGMQLE